MECYGVYVYENYSKIDDTVFGKKHLNTSKLTQINVCLSCINKQTQSHPLLDKSSIMPWSICSFNCSICTLPSMVCPMMRCMCDIVEPEFTQNYYCYSEVSVHFTACGLWWCCLETSIWKQELLSALIKQENRFRTHDIQEIVSKQ